MSEFIGKFHPLVVHLPIGFIVLTLILKILDTYRPNLHIQALLPILLKLCFGSVLIATLTGYIMPKGSDFDETLLDRHFWSGVALSVISFLMLIPQLTKWHKYGYWLMGISITVAGHLGGSLTHGELFFNLSNQNDENSLTKNGTVYQDVIYPILHDKCITCHNNAKSKGGLKMHEYDLLMKGGKSGQVVIAKDLDKSELYLRMLLPESDEHHMPPKGKTQPTTQEIALIKWWIENGADKSILVADIPKDDPIVQSLSLVTSDISQKKTSLPRLEPLSITVRNKLSDQGFTLVPIDKELNYYKLIISKFENKDLKELDDLKPYILELQIGNETITPQFCETITSLPNLLKLKLANSTFEKESILNIENMAQLEMLNLVGTKGVNDNLKISNLPPNLKSIFLYKSDFYNMFLPIMKKYPKITVDTGGYIVPILETDTTYLTIE